jgi:tocopherol O-methyltransferase
VQPTYPQPLLYDGAYSPSPVSERHRREQYKVVLPPSLESLAAYYDGKTQAILRRYGPGPRVHFHTGLASEPRPGAGLAELRAWLVDAQERMLRYGAEAWQIPAIRFADVLDVGCGLGGGAIFWAQKFASKVTAVTIAPSHIELVRMFAAEAGVGSRVQALLCDALAVPGSNCFDAAVAIDSSSSFPRAPWFERLSRLLRPGGHVFIFDCFLVRPEYEEPFNRHWCAQIGTMEEYLTAARQAGFLLKRIEDVSPLAVHFWTATLAFMEAETQTKSLSKLETGKLEESSRIHALVRQGLREGGLRHTLMAFVRQ